MVILNNRKKSDKIQHHSWFKQQLSVNSWEGNFINLLKGIYKIPIAITYLMVTVFKLLLIISVQGVLASAVAA